MAKKKKNKGVVVKKKKKLIIIITSIVIVLIALAIFLYSFGLTAVSKKSENVKFKVSAGESKITVIQNLKTANLIRSQFPLFIYVFFNSDLNLQAGEYMLNRNMSATEIIEVIANGDIIDDRKVVSMTFVEGKRLKSYVKLISENTEFTEDEIINKINDKEFLKSLIDKYWFITEDVLNDELYYPLEGYLFPSTYEFYADSTIETIIYRMLDEMGKKLEPYKDKMTEKNLTVHKVLSMAAIIEKEALSSEDRKTVSQVIYKRLALNMNLGMDVTTYYAVQKDLTEPLTKVDLSTNNPYNTRNSSVIGLPVGAICSPSLDSIDAVFNPSDTDYIYFYADIVTGKVYFANTYEEFIQYKQELGG